MSARRLLDLAREALLLELALYRSLARWIARRPDVPAGATPIGYAQLVGPMLWLWIFGSAVETVAVEVVLRHLDAAWADAIRVPLLVLGVWGVLWMLGLLASYRVRPHHVDAERLRLRCGARTWVDIPLTAVAGCRLDDHDMPGTIRSVHHEHDLLLLGVSGRTNLELELTGVTPLRSSKGELVASRVGFWVDSPRDVVRDIAPLIPAGP